MKKITIVSILGLSLFGFFSARKAFAQQAIRCHDTDFSIPGQIGEDRFIRGTVTSTTRNRRGGRQVQRFWDTCQGENLIEHACRNITHVRQTFRCPEGESCMDGACVVPPVVLNECENPAGGWQSGRTYVFNQDLYCDVTRNPATGVMVFDQSVTNVTVDCQNHRIRVNNDSDNFPLP